ncbi:hypothetical protein LTR53_005159 [Teratosphaeriaceae sp. CCFEE 6253]|nr:hypothetical protein LTR53_005159 [Teratosphaeriaceae sp. CCFEE 6253]
MTRRKLKGLMMGRRLSTELAKAAGRRAVHQARTRPCEDYYWISVKSDLAEDLRRSAMQATEDEMRSTRSPPRPWPLRDSEPTPIMAFLSVQHSSPCNENKSTVQGERQSTAASIVWSSDNHTPTDRRLRVDTGNIPGTMNEPKSRHVGPANEACIFARKMPSKCARVGEVPTAVRDQGGERRKVTDQHLGTIRCTGSESR